MRQLALRGVSSYEHAYELQQGFLLVKLFATDGSQTVAYFGGGVGLAALSRSDYRQRLVDSFFICSLLHLQTEFSASVSRNVPSSCAWIDMIRLVWSTLPIERSKAQ